MSISTSHAATLSQAISGLSAGTQYYFKVTAFNGIGEGAASAEASTYTNATPEAPTSLSISGYSENELTVNWVIAAGTGYKDGSSVDLTGFTVYYSKTQGFGLTDVDTLSQAVSGGTATSQAITGLLAGTQYYFKVTASNATSESAASTEANTYTNEKPTAPQNVSISGHPGTEVTVSWEAPAGKGYYAGSIAALTSFKVYYSKTSGFDLNSAEGSQEVSDETATSLDISGLDAGTQYYFKVTASSGSGESEASAEANTYTNATPGAPTGLSINGYSETGFTVSWAAPTETGYTDGSTAALTGFKVYYSETQNFDLTSVTPITISNAATLSQVISSLTAGTQYYIKVTASNAVGESAASTEANTYTNGASDSPENFKALLTITHGVATLTWRAPTNKGYIDGSAATAISYKVYSSNSDITDTAGLTPAYTGTDLSYTFTGNIGTSYYFAVTANNSIKDSPLAKTGPFTLASTLLNLDPNGGLGAVETTGVDTSGTTITIPVPTGITKTDSIIAAWNTAADGSGTYYDVTETITLTTDLTLYAMWSTDGLAYTLINSDMEYSVKGGTVPTTATDVEVPQYWKGKKVTEVGDKAFYNYNALTDIKLPSTITVIQNEAFRNCYNLTLTSLPDGITSIGTSALRSCFKLALTSLPSGLKRLENLVFKDSTEVNFASLPDGLEYIGESSLVETKSSFTTLPNTVKTLANYAFAGTEMTSMTIPASVTSLGASLFFYNDSITEVTLEGDYSTLTKTFEPFPGIFDGGLHATVKITNDTTPATLVGTVFPTTVTSIQVPASAVAAYQAAWTNYAGIISALP
ncbi:MAG: hypothetical protein B0D92_04600 [Spirochaeta sp. LUC14_002_19_P3]|nr:MAG: hypothetical protein B0D92_04600 [Spirochaeta sp. LUC14_002_19_P3]